MFITVDSRTAWRFLRIYGIETPVADARITRTSLEVPVTIEGVMGADRMPIVRVKTGGVRAFRKSPLTEEDARGMAAELQKSGAIPTGEVTARTLWNLLVRCSRLHAESGIAELHLLIYLTAQGYRTHAVYMQRQRFAYAKRMVSL